MEAATKERELSGDKAQRIIDAMRDSVARRGAAGSTFEHVAREAGVSRGLLHYYFGTKERLLVEVVRRDTELRVERLDARLAPAKTGDDVIDALVSSLTEVIENEPGFFLLLYELFSAGRRNPNTPPEVGQLF
jgi:AcrR family transcriptional regulator